MTKRRYAAMLFIALATLGWGACTQQRDPCLQPKVASLIFHTYRVADTGTAVTDSALPEAIIGAISDEHPAALLYPTSSSFTISLSPLHDTCSWYISPDSTLTPFDTLTFYYQRKLQFLSNACGYTYFYNINNVLTTHNNIDSVIVLNNSVTNNVNTQHLKIYIHH